MKILDIINNLKALGYSPENGSNDIWKKNYLNGLYTIRVNIGRTPTDSIIDYGTKIKYDRKTTMNFSVLENLVVFECVNRLLEQGYAPECITLEKAYQAGRNDQYLDILVTHNKIAYMMIECKTWGNEYKKYKNELINKGGQLMSYWIQDRDAKILVLYSSHLNNNKIEVAYSALETNPLSGSNLKIVHESWDKAFFETGVFEGDPYKLKERYIRVRDLKDMASSDGGRIFNAFREILRRHVISDKPNAFNKIFNLFICKVQDEEKEDLDTKLDFQWHSEEDAETVLNRLNDLYKKGLKEYLKMDVADHSIEELEYNLNSMSESQRIELKRMFNELRLYKNNEFAFIEVYDRKTFLQNAEVVKDVVRLLQNKRIRYTHKQPFMGDFFERLLNTSVKQESGQFFTPIPVARFICDSLPIEEIVEEKITKKEPKFLPHIIDYASGSGHFLTEGMDRIDEILQQVGKQSGLTRSQKANYNSWKENYLWAKEFVYGIEKDYRLAKTAKVSCFLNGDGEANIIRGDGLDHFEKSIEYKENGGILSKTANSYGQDNPVFDVVVANPPYSVWQCKLTIKNGDESFTLWRRLTENSDDIECLFAERTKQLLKDGGVAGVIFPVSILTSNGIEEDTRDIILKHFDIKGIIVLGSATFMKANVATAILFMRRRSDSIWKAAYALVERFYETWCDTTINNIQNAVSCYANYVFGMSIADYILAVRDQSNRTKNKVFSEYYKKFNNLNEIKSLIKTKRFSVLSKEEQDIELKGKLTHFIIKCESEKLLHFVLAFRQKTVLAKAPSDIIGQKVFLGYEFNERMGYEGLWPVNGEKIESMLYDEDRRNNPFKINTLIHKNFNNEDINIPEILKQYVDLVFLHELMQFDGVEFDKSISQVVDNRKKKAKDGMIKAADLVEFIQGVTFSKADQRMSTTNKRILTASHINNFDHSVNINNAIFIDDAVEVDLKTKLRKDDIFLSTANSIEHLGKYTLIKEDIEYYAGGFCAILRSKQADATKYLQLFLNGDNYKKIIAKQSNVASICNFNRQSFLEWEVPFLDKVKRDWIVKKYSCLEELELIHGERIANLKDNINSDVWNCINDNRQEGVSIGDCFIVNPSRSEVKNMNDDDDVTFLPMSAVSIDGKIIKRETRKFSEVKKGFTYFREGDILFAKITPCMENGKGSLASKLMNGIGFGTTEFHVLRQNGQLNNLILFYFLQNKKFRLLAKPHMTGKAGQKRIPAEYIKKYRIKVPSNDEQVQLMNKINDTEKRISKHETAITRILTIKKKLISKYLL